MGGGGSKGKNKGKTKEQNLAYIRDGNFYFICRSFKLVRIFGRVVLGYIGRGEAAADRQKRPPGEDGGSAQVTFE